MEKQNHSTFAFVKGGDPCKFRGSRFLGVNDWFVWYIQKTRFIPRSPLWLLEKIRIFVNLKSIFYEKSGWPFQSSLFPFSMGVDLSGIDGKTVFHVLLSSSKRSFDFSGFKQTIFCKKRGWTIQTSWCFPGDDLCDKDRKADSFFVRLTGSKENFEFLRF